MIDNIKSEIQCLRVDIGVEFQRWHNEAKQLASYIGTEDERRRVPSVGCNTNRIYLLTHLFSITRDHTVIPFIDILVQQLQNRFSAGECFAESNTIFNCQTRVASPREISIMA